MPLLDHFRPPLSVQRPWESFHSAWATALAFHLNGGVLPAEYYAMPLLQATGRVEVDVATLQGSESVSEPGGTALWSPPQPTATIPIEMPHAHAFEVQVFQNFGGPQLRATVELVSPGNKDRPAARRAFASKCADYLRSSVSVIVVDVVTERQANLHAEILSALDQTAPSWDSPSRLYAVAYHGVLGSDGAQLQMWQHVLRIGSPLPEVPMWLSNELSVPVRLEESYSVTCERLRMRV